MFYSPKLYFRDWWIGIPLLVSVLAQIAMWVYLIAYIQPSAESIFLHYNTTFGVDLIGEWWKIFFLPTSGLIVLLINFGISWFWYGSEKLLARTLGLWAGIMHIFLLIGVYLIAGLNI